MAGLVNPIKLSSMSNLNLIIAKHEPLDLKIIRKCFLRALHVSWLFSLMVIRLMDEEPTQI